MEGASGEPLTFGGAFARAFGIYGRQFLRVVAVAAVFAIPAAFVLTAIQHFTTPEAFRGGAGAPDVDGDDFARFGLGIFASVVMTLPLTALMFAALFRLARDADARRASVGAAVSYAFQRAIHVALLVLLAYGLLMLVVLSGIFLGAFLGFAIGGTVAAVLLAVLLGLATLVLTLWLATAWFPAVPALLEEDLGPMRALGRSRELVRGSWWTVFGILIVAALMVGAASGVIGMIFGTAAALTEGATRFVFDLIGNAINSLVVTPIMALFAVAVYDGLRATKSLTQR